ncbi:unnamed protein product [Rotaria magnacalcarata]|nr:unnamed protein product [Rotaria magnacalcarata]
MIVVSQLTPAPDLYIIHLKQVIPEETLLELPFEGAQLYPKKKRSWYQKKRFIIPLCLCMLLCIGAIIIGTIIGVQKPNQISSILFL